jgi:hypothetical protein
VLSHGSRCATNQSSTVRSMPSAPIIASIVAVPAAGW